MKLKLVSAIRRRKSVVDIRRTKLWEAGRSDRAGNTWSPYGIPGQAFARGGRRRRASRPRDGSARVKQWWWKASDGKLLFTVSTAPRRLNCEGKPAIEVTRCRSGRRSKAFALRVEAGELDGHIETASASLGQAFKRKAARTGARAGLTGAYALLRRAPVRAFNADRGSQRTGLRAR